MSRLRTLTALLVLALAWSAAQEGPRAYRGINFGDSLAEVARKVYEDEAFTLLAKPLAAVYGNPPQSLIERGAVNVIIAGRPYYVHFDFQDDHLVGINIRSETASVIYFDTVVREAHDTLAEVIIRARGEPLTARQVAFHEVWPGRFTTAYSWAETEDGVRYRTVYGEYDYNYYAALVIEWASYLDALEAGREARREADLNDAANDF
jgi:hypothetical protein